MCLIAIKLIFEDPEKYGFYFKQSDLYDFIPTRKVEVKGKVGHWADFAKKEGINYKILKYFNPWLRESYLTNKSKKKYIISIPEKGYRTFTYPEDDVSDEQ